MDYYTVGALNGPYTSIMQARAAYGRVMCGTNAAVEGDTVMFKGGFDVAVAKMMEPLTPFLNYFEYLIVDRGEEAAIGIGVGERQYPLTVQPGWRENSIGYHADNGKLYHEVGHGEVFGPVCTTGDRMGCGVCFYADCRSGYVRVFFTKNGGQIGDVVEMKLPPGEYRAPHGNLYPLIGLNSWWEKVRYLGTWYRLPETSQPKLKVYKGYWW